MNISIQGQEWTVRFLSEEMVARLAVGDDKIVHDVFHHSWPQALIEKFNYYHPLALIIYEAHVLAAAYEQFDIARSFYVRGKLGEIIWNGSDLAYPSRICPVCFHLMGNEALDACLDCDGGHFVFRYSFELQSCELKSEDEIAAKIFQQVMSESANFDDVSEELFADDFVGRALQSAFEDKLWFHDIPGGEKLEVFAESWDLDNWGDIIYYGYHPEGLAFVDRILEYYQLMVERCQKCGLDACEDYWG